MAEGFTGFSTDAIGFWKKLEKNNNREWFQAHKEVYERGCREPMQALLAALLPQYGPSKVSRINRDMRFAREGGPYKNYIAAGVGGAYISLSKQGLWVGGGMYKPDPAALRRFRAAVDDRASGAALAKLVTALGRKGYGVDTHDRLAGAPKGYAIDHPRIDLLRMKDIFAGQTFAKPSWPSTAKAVAEITRAIEGVKPLQQWLRDHVGSTQHRSRR